MRLLTSVAALLLLGGCSHLPASHCAGPAQALVEDQLFFGQSIPGGATVSDAQWQAFLRDEATPRFPQGLSVVDAAGQWRGDDGTIVREDTRVLILVRADDAAGNAAAQAIADAYKTQFAQESVMRLTRPVCARF